MTSIERPRRPLALFAAAAMLLASVGGAAAQTSPQTPKLQTLKPPKTELLAASHILIQYAGAQRAGANITRTKDEALERARMVAEKARAGESFAELARTYSDGPSGPQGGSLGIFAPQRMVPEFARATQALGVGATSDPVESAFGYHVILREKVELVSARHILVMHTESTRKPASITRTKDEALERAREVLRRARAGEEFAKLAEELSDGPSKTKGGDLGSFPRGRMVPAFDEAVFALGVNEVSGVVETPFGYHIIQRYE